MNISQALEIIRKESELNNNEDWRSTYNGNRLNIPNEIYYNLYEKDYIDILGRGKRPTAIKLTKKGWKFVLDEHKHDKKENE